MKKVLHFLKMQWYELQIRMFGAWNFFLKQQQRSEKSLLKNNYKEKCSAQVSNCVVFTCNGLGWSGGLADRLRGIVSI